ncbi:MAG TPA: 3-hydroxyacyl-CoA dehydrogenase NAD-binding domain-containing protein [Vicinamibacterales bacterium]|nr:3-hydroxyacyl-CoA dehydrogenase NAD-binding domain-containing protein [Vicinamibacterales bacterium]
MVNYELHDGVAVLTIDNPPVNALSPEIWSHIETNVARAVKDPGASAIVLIGAGTTFIAGADIKVFDTLKTVADSMARSAGTHELLKRVEDAAKPTVAAIHGNALGGGLEVAQACHYRVAAKDAKVGQPEVLLGIIPGAGGTQRLTRLCGARIALEMSTDGKPVGATKAKAAGIVDEVFDIPSSDYQTFRRTAVAYAKAKSAIRKTRDIAHSSDAVEKGKSACAEIRASLGKTARGARAPFAVVDAIEAGLSTSPKSFDQGSVRERELFAECVVSRESRALRHLFFAEREVAKIPDVPKDTPAKDIRRAAVVGAGTMGGGIAMNYANAGIPVLLKEVDQASLDRGLATIRRNYEVTMSKGKLTREQVEKTIALITPQLTYDGFDQVDIVTEAVFENMDLKKKTFAELGKVTRADCVLASNSSTLDIDQFAQASGRPSQVLGHHYFSPANVMKLLEIVRGKETGKEVLATSLKLAKKIGKVGVVVGNCFGFVANRMLAYYMREAYLLLEEGASVPQIDKVLTDFGLPVGPYGMQDIAGIDVGARIRQYLASIGKTRAEGPQSAIPDRLYEMGRYGQKTGAGWYKYAAPGSRDRMPDLLIEQMADEEAKKRGITRRPITDADILARITTALANEGARVLEDGFATRAGDIDIIYCYGFGFPRHSGGPMFYADTVGLPTVLARVKEYRARFGDYWEPAPLLEKMVAEGRSFY